MTYRMIITHDTFMDYVKLVNTANSIKNKFTEEYRKLLNRIKEIESKQWHWIVTYSPTQKNENTNQVELFCE